MNKMIYAFLAFVFLSGVAKADNPGFEEWSARHKQAVDLQIAGDQAFFFSVVEARLGIPASELQQNAHCDQTNWGCNNFYFVTTVGNIECGHRRSPYGLDPGPSDYYCTEGTYYELHPKLFWISEEAIRNRNLKIQSAPRALPAKQRKPNQIQQKMKGRRQSAPARSGLEAPSAPAAPAAPSAF